MLPLEKLVVIDFFVPDVQREAPAIACPAIENLEERDLLSRDKYFDHWITSNPVVEILVT